MMKLPKVLSSVVALAFGASGAVAQVTTSQYDNLRTGATLNEKTLTPQNVNAQQFGKLGAFKVDGAVYAQPLFVPAVEIPGQGKHDVLFVATEHDSVYAFDAYRPNDAPLWHVILLDKKRGEEAVSAGDVQCPFIQPEVGITSTPLIDLQSGTLYVLARTTIGHFFKDNEYFQRLHALAITTGAEKFGGPVQVTASVRGRGDRDKNGEVRFDALHENPRAGLLLVNNAVYLNWGSSCDVATLLPDQPGAHRHLLLQPGKGSMIYVIDRDQMGQFHAEGDAVLQRVHISGSGMGAMAYWNGHAYFACSGDSLRDYALVNGQLKLRSSSSIRFADPGATPSVSADGGKNAIVWAIATKTWNGPGQRAVLYAFDAKHLSEPIYTSEQNSKRDQAGNGHAICNSCGGKWARVFWREG